jgi:hypothetical protein
MRFDLSAGFPLLTTKRLHVKSIIYELLWFIAGDTNVRTLQENGVRIWDEWAGRMASWGRCTAAVAFVATPDGRTIDQLGDVIAQIKRNPDSRRLIVSAWNVGDIERMALPPCHVLFQFYVANGRLSCQLYQRSVDVFLGLPFNIASYALLTSDGGARLRLASRRLRPHVGRRAPLPQPLRAGAAAAHARAAPPATDAHQPCGALHLGFPLRGLRAGGVRPAPTYQGDGGGVALPPAPLS